MKLPTNCETLSECDLECEGGMDAVAETFIILGSVMVGGSVVLGVLYRNRAAIMNFFRRRHRPIVNGDAVGDDVPADVIENLFFQRQEN